MRWATTTEKKTDPKISWSDENDNEVNFTDNVSDHSWG